jgi:methyl-accepting chemotaxis protein
MKSTSTGTASVARRLALRSITLLAVVLFAISMVISVVEERNARTEVRQNVTDKVQSLVTVVDAADQMSRDMLVRAFGGFKQYFDARLVLDEATGELKTAGAVINNDFSSVDKFTRDTGSVATVFARKGDDFLRVTTSLKKQDGERAMGTLLDRAHPAYKLMLAGQPYTGRAVLFGKPYMTYYEPALDAAGKVVGILFVGTDVSAFDASVEKQVAEVRFFETGGLYVIDPRASLQDAVFLVHPQAKGKKVLEAYPQGEKFFASLAAAPDGFVEEAPNILGGPAADEWSLLRKAQTSKWWVVAEVSDDEAMREPRAAMRVIWGLLALATVLLGLGLFITVRRTISTPLAELTTAITSVGQGDLTQPFHSDRNDEIGTLVREVEAMRQRYLQTLSQVQSSANSIHTASSEIASGAQDLSARTEQTAANLEQTAASMEQLTSTVRQSTDASRQANELAASASAVAVRGGQVVGQVVSTMSDINESSRRIADIIGVIDGIAFQTNILALNAAVEAARAGEQGRGFAVVASEVRSLAQRSATAAREIKALIGTSVAKVDNGERLVREAGTTMNEIVQSVQRVGAMLEQITAAASEQSQGIGQVNVAITQLDQMTQQNAALVEESAAAAESLQEQAGRLSQAVQVFQLGQVENRVAPPPRPARPIRPAPLARPAAKPAVRANTPYPKLR